MAQSTLNSSIHTVSSELEDTKSTQPRKLPKYKVTLQNINWIPAAFIISVHLAALAGFFTFTWQALVLCIVMHWVTGGLGITFTYHRLLTHKSFEVPQPLKYVLAAIACLACQGGPVSWVGAHRLHHAKSDLDGDPHTPLNGFFWSHMGWCLSKNEILDNFEVYSKHAPDLAKDRVMVLIDKLHIVPTVLLAALFYAWGGWSFVIWGIFVRLVMVWHCTWLVNSAAHVWGYKTYDSKDDSRNLWWVALLTYGEGWHNNHHAFQHSARHGLKWWEFDTTYFAIRLFKMFGLASEIKLPTKDLLAKKLGTAAGA